MNFGWDYRIKEKELNGFGKRRDILDYDVDDFLLIRERVIDWFNSELLCNIQGKNIIDKLLFIFNKSYLSSILKKRLYGGDYDIEVLLKVLLEFESDFDSKEIEKLLDGYDISKIEFMSRIINVTNILSKEVSNLNRIYDDERIECIFRKIGNGTSPLVYSLAENVLNTLYTANGHKKICGENISNIDLVINEESKRSIFALRCPIRNICANHP